MARECSNLDALRCKLSARARLRRMAKLIMETDSVSKEEAMATAREIVEKTRGALWLT